MDEKPKRKPFAVQVLLFIVTNPDMRGGFLGLMMVLAAMWGIAQIMRGEADSFVNPSVISDTMVSGNCAITILYNPQKADQVLFSIDCTAEQFGQYVIQLEGREMRDYGEVATAIHWISGEGTYLHEAGSTNITNDTSVISLRFEPEGAEELYVSIRIR